MATVPSRADTLHLLERLIHVAPRHEDPQAETAGAAARSKPAQESPSQPGEPRVTFKNSTLALLAACCLATPAAWAEPDLTAPEALAAAQAGKLRLIDIRTQQEWRQTGVAPGAARVDMYQGPQAFTRQLLDVVAGDRSAPIGLICRTGNRTTQAQKHLQSLGFTQVYNIREGMAGSAAGLGWLRRGLAVEACGQC